MKLALIGLGKMGYNLALNLIDHGHEVVAYDIDVEQVKRISAEGAVSATSLTDVVQQLQPPRIIWLMVPAGDVTENVFSTLEPLLESGDIVIDGETRIIRIQFAVAINIKKKAFIFLIAVQVVG